MLDFFVTGSGMDGLRRVNNALKYTSGKGYGQRHYCTEGDQPMSAKEAPFSHFFSSNQRHYDAVRLRQ